MSTALTIDPKRVLALDAYLCPRCVAGAAESPYCRLCEGTGIVNLATHAWYTTIPTSEIERFGVPRLQQTPLELRARIITENALVDQVDHTGTPAFTRVLRIANMAIGSTDRITTLLHYACVQSDVESVEHICTAPILAALHALQPQANEPYRNYVERICTWGELPTRVLLAILRDDVTHAPAHRRRAIIASALIVRTLDLKRPYGLPAGGLAELTARTEPL